MTNIISHSFKLLAYEYSPQVAMFVYLGAPLSKRYLDDEEKDIKPPRTERHGGINFTLSNGAHFYIIPVIPDINNEKVIVNTFMHIFYDIIKDR